MPVKRHLQFNEARLRNMIRQMKPRWRFYQILREELRTAGYWREKKRGQPGWFREDGSDKRAGKQG